jgi:hypothetical protein
VTKTSSDTDLAVPSPWIRIERRFSGRRVPTELRTLGDLFTNRASFDPFSDLEINQCYDVTPEMIYDWHGPLKQRQNAAWALTLINQHGRAVAKRIIRKEHRNAKDVFAVLDKIFTEVATLIPPSTEIRWCSRFATQASMHLAGQEGFRLGFQ